MLKCNSNPDKHVFLYLFPDSLCVMLCTYPVLPSSVHVCIYFE